MRWSIGIAVAFMVAFMIFAAWMGSRCSPRITGPESVEFPCGGGVGELLTEVVAVSAAIVSLAIGAIILVFTLVVSALRRRKTKEKA